MNLQYLRRLLSVVCVCLCVLCLSSHIVYADDTITYNLDGENSELNLMYHWFVNDNAHLMYNGPAVNNTNYTEKSYIQSLSGWSNETKLKDRLYFSMNDGSKMFSKGSNVEVNITGISNFNEYDNLLYSLIKSENYTVRVEALTFMGHIHKLRPSSFDIVPYSMNYTYNLSFTLENIPCNVYYMYIIVEYNGSLYNKVKDYYGTSVNMTHRGGLYQSKFEFIETKADKNDVETQEKLSSIIDIITNIKDYIFDLPDNIAESIEGFFDNIVNALSNLGDMITNALSNLGSFLLDGIKSLFVPSENDIVNMKDKWEQLLADRFGAIYQAVALIFDYVDAFQEHEQGTIEFPLVSIPLGEVDFEFGGYTVKVVPDGFDILINALKMAVSISCTVLFVNTLKRKYDKLVEG